MYCAASNDTRVALKMQENNAIDQNNLAYLKHMP
jgi:hypothetical protein